jgi:hypothetical protein
MTFSKGQARTDLLQYLEQYPLIRIAQSSAHFYNYFKFEVFEILSALFITPDYLQSLNGIALYNESILKA